MAQFVVETTQEERDAVLHVLRTIEGQTVPVSRIADLAGLKASRTRYALSDLIEMKLVERVPTKAFNKHYVRYAYKITDPQEVRKDFQ